MVFPIFLSFAFFPSLSYPLAVFHPVRLCSSQCRFSIMHYLFSHSSQFCLSSFRFRLFPFRPHLFSILLLFFWHLDDYHSYYSDLACNCLAMLSCCIVSSRLSLHLLRFLFSASRRRHSVFYLLLPSLVDVYFACFYLFYFSLSISPVLVTSFYYSFSFSIASPFIPVVFFSFSLFFLRSYFIFFCSFSLPWFIRSSFFLLMFSYIFILFSLRHSYSFAFIACSCSWIPS